MQEASAGFVRMRWAVARSNAIELCSCVARDLMAKHKRGIRSEFVPNRTQVATIGTLR